MHDEGSRCADVCVPLLKKENLILLGEGEAEDAVFSGKSFINT